MGEFVALVKKSGADFAQFRPFTGDLYDITETYLALKEKCEDFQFGMRASMQKYAEIKHGGHLDCNRCRGMFFSTVMTADAKVFACLHNRQREAYCLGQITDEVSRAIFSEAYGCARRTRALTAHNAPPCAQ